MVSRPTTGVPELLMVLLDIMTDSNNIWKPMKERARQRHRDRDRHHTERTQI